MRGTVQRIYRERGFGFIRRSEGDQAGYDVFFHMSDLVGCAMNDLEEGTELTFEIRESPRGPRAEQIEKA